MKVWGEDVVFRPNTPKAKDVGETETLGVAPTPVTDVDRVPEPELVWKVMLPENRLALEGVKVLEKVADWPGARLTGSAGPDTAN